jgi:hypothetical protein
VREPKEIDHLEDIGIDGDNFKVDLQETGWGMDWSDLIHRRDRWRAILSIVKNFRFTFREFLD